MKITVIKIPRITEKYDVNAYNLKAFKRKPRGNWVVLDAGRDLKQARSLILAHPPGAAVIVSTPAYKEFPYHIYSNEALMQKRFAQIRNGVRFK